MEEHLILQIISGLKFTIHGRTPSFLLKKLVKVSLIPSPAFPDRLLFLGDRPSTITSRPGLMILS